MSTKLQKVSPAVNETVSHPTEINLNSLERNQEMLILNYYIHCNRVEVYKNTMVKVEVFL